MRGINWIVGIFAAAMVATSSGKASQDAPAAAPVRQGEPATVKKAAVQIYDEKADARKEIAAALVIARKENRRVLIQWGGNWCGWCVKLHRLFTTDIDIAKKLQYEYVVVYVDAGRPDDKNMELASSYGADLKTHGFPFLTVLNGRGSALANHETGTFENKDQENFPGHDPKAVLAFLTEHQAPYLNAADVLATGIDMAKQADKRVFLHFGAPWCGWCQKLEAWMDRKDVAGILARDFIDVKIDVERTVGGKEMLEKLSKRKSTGLPWMAFLDSEGRNLIDGNGPTGNIGFPSEKKEIEHFREMLKKATRAITLQEVDQLIVSLRKKEG